MTPALLLFQAGQPSELGSAGSEALAYIKLLVALGVVLAAAVFAVRVLLPRLAAGRQAAPGVIQVAARLPLEPRKNLYVVKVGAEYLLIGTSESGMQCLTTLDRANIETTLDARKPSETEFSALMQAFRRWKKAS